jgi:hypothetical protein
MTRRCWSRPSTCRDTPALPASSRTSCTPSWYDGVAATPRTSDATPIKAYQRLTILFKRCSGIHTMDFDCWSQWLVELLRQDYDSSQNNIGQGPGRRRGVGRGFLGPRTRYIDTATGKWRRLERCGAEWTDCLTTVLVGGSGCCITSQLVGLLPRLPLHNFEVPSPFVAVPGSDAFPQSSGPKASPLSDSAWLPPSPSTEEDGGRGVPYELNTTRLSARLCTRS